MWDDRKLHGKVKKAPPLRSRLQRREGQALVEYALIVALVVIGLVVILSLVGPALGNVFSNQVYNLIGQNGTPFPTFVSQETFWAYVTAVASYTPIQPAFATFTPIGITSPTFTPTSVIPTVSAVPSDTRTPTTTPTDGPSPTPTDKFLALPYADSGDDRAIWYMPASNDSSAWSALPWNTFTANSNPGCGVDPGSTNPVFVYNGGLVIDYSNPTHAVPNGGTNFYVKYTQTNVRFEGRPYNYSIRVGPNDCARLSISGITAIDVAGDSANGLPGYGEGIIALPPDDFVPTPAQTQRTVTVEYWAGDSSSFRQLFFNLNPVADYVDAAPPGSETCKWAQGGFGTGRTEPASLHYAKAYNSTRCDMRLRGYMDVPNVNGTDTIPALTFWDKYNLKVGAFVQVGVREYTWDGSNNLNWDWVTVHTGLDTSATFGQRYYNLANFGGKDYRGKRIEVAFRMDSQGASGPTFSVWTIDDLNIYVDAIPTFYIESSDDADTVTGNLSWTYDCQWGPSTALKHNGARAYTDSPPGAYLANTDCSMATKGVLDLAGYTDPAEPEVDLWTNFIVATGTEYTFEYQKIEDRGTTSWYAMTPRGSSDPWIGNGSVLGSETSSGWNEKAFSLLNLLNGTGPETSPSRKYFFRLRMKTGTATDDGAYVDEIKFRKRPSSLRTLPFYEPFNSGNDWTLEGEWTVSAAFAQRSLGGALHDSRDPDVQMGTTNAILVPQMQLVGTTNPKVEFWIRQDLLAGVNIYFESQIETDSPGTWRTMWKFEPGTDPINEQKNLAWQHIVIPVSDVGGTAYIGHQMSLRFRLQAVTDEAVDGVIIDDLRVWDETTPYVISANPFYDGMESQTEIIANSTSNWWAGGDWKLTGQDRRSGLKAWYTSNPDVTNRYPSPGTSTLEFTGTLDLAGVPDPVLSFWTKHDLTVDHYIMVEAKLASATTWTNVGLNLERYAGEGLLTQPIGKNTGWTRQVVVFSANGGAPNPNFYGQKINIRFRLVALPPAVVTSPYDVGGWYLDDVYVGSRNQSNLGIPYGTNFSGNTDIDNWTMEGNWQAAGDFSPWDVSGAAAMEPVSYNFGTKTTSSWLGNYYHLFTGSDPKTFDPTVAGAVCADYVGYQISPLTTVGTLATGAVGTGTVTWSNGSPLAAPSPSPTNKSISVSSAGSEFSFDVPADANFRTLKVYFVGVTDVGGGVIGTTATLSDGGVATQTVNQTLSTTPTEYVYTITDYKTTTTPPSVAKLRITLRINSGNSNTKLYLRAITLTTPVASLSVPALAPAITAFIPSGLDLATEGTSDWTAFGNYATGAPDRKSCAKLVSDRESGALNFQWNAANPPIGAASQWITNAAEHEYFYVSFKRAFTVSAGTFRFWVTGNDGFSVWKQKVGDPSPTQLTPTMALSYPFKSPDTNPGVYRTGPTYGTGEYFYEEPFTAGTYIIEVRYFKKDIDAAATAPADDAFLRFRMSSNQAAKATGGYESNTVLHSSASVSVNYAIGQRTGAYLGNKGWVTTGTIEPTSGGISIPGGTAVRISYFARMSVGGSPGAPDFFHVYYSKNNGNVSDGTLWEIPTIKRAQRNGAAYAVDGSGNPIYDIVSDGSGNYFNYGDYNLTDEATSVSLYSTYQNWDQYVIDIPADAFPYVLNLKFEIDSRANTNAASTGGGWYIDNLLVIPN